MYLCMGQTRDDAYREVQAAMRQRFGDDAWEIDPATLPLGTPADCIETLEAFVRAGVTHFIINALCTPEALLPTYERFAAEVIPHFAR
jgi:alkanesulfonate monooxygenase SsuD/methylene tetrahydromethanopterin reductase-like flavin-dependent oxidoreductase (luciferase family)